jgi:hypothetical protein
VDLHQLPLDVIDLFIRKRVDNISSEVLLYLVRKESGVTILPNTVKVLIELLTLSVSESELERHVTSKKTPVDMGSTS